MGNRTEMRSAYPSLPKNLSLWTLGIGTAEGGNIPMGFDLFGNPVVKEVNGVPIVSRLSEELLRKIAQN